MKFLLLYMVDEVAAASIPMPEVDAVVAEKTRVGQALWAQGKNLGGARLWPSATATRLTRRDGQFTAVDGPFAETKEVVGGFNLIECASKAEAIEWAKRFQCADWGTVEVRPVWERCLCHGAYDCSSQV
jgi:hypothetical protein